MVARRNLFLMAAALEPELNPAALRYGPRIKPRQKAAMPPPITDFDTLLNTELLTVSSSSETWPGRPAGSGRDSHEVHYDAINRRGGRGAAVIWLRRFPKASPALSWSGSACNFSAVTLPSPPQQVT